MNKPSVIEINSLSKKFCKSIKRGVWYGTKDILKSYLGLSLKNESLREKEFWALENINITLKQGESLGLIGTNGSGKTTLLRIIAGIFKPDIGSFKVHGRVNPLISVGAGFHPHMTGRENIYLNGSILGMRQSDIKKKFDEIVAFSELEDFLDSPVSTYSSGMYVRLGFAIAIHVPAEVLLIDEILAVGDLSFQTKCLREINKFKSNGGSIVLVTHSMFNVRGYCDRVVWLEKGKIKMDGDINSVTQNYELYNADLSREKVGDVFVHQDVAISDITFPEHIKAYEDFPFRFTIAGKVEEPLILLHLFSADGRNVTNAISYIDGFKPEINNAKKEIIINLEKLNLSDGLYYVNLIICSKAITNRIAVFDRVMSFKMINDKPNFSDGEIMRVNSTWKIQ